MTSLSELEISEEHEHGPSKLEPKLVASTSSTPGRTHPGSGVIKQDQFNYFSQAQWTADGTTLITNSADQQIRTYIVPPDLLDEHESPHVLKQYCAIPSTESVYATTLYPGFNLQDPSTTLVLSSIRDHPIRLNSALSAGLVSSYSLINQNTEAYICPHSLVFSGNGSRFLAGSDSLISVFDISRPGSGPLSQLPTVSSKRRKSLGGGIGMKGIISAMSVEPSSSILAVGTFTSQIGLYAAAGEGDTIGVLPLAGSEAHDRIGGRGVTQVKWSPCGAYLYVVERMSDGVLIYDIRNTGQLLGWLEGRQALTNQRLGVDVFATSQTGGHEVWAGGADGFVRFWTNPHASVGAQVPTYGWKAHNDAVASATLHPAGSVAASCSGQRHFPVYSEVSDESTSDDGPSMNLAADNSLNIWDLSSMSFESQLG